MSISKKIGLSSSTGAEQTNMTLPLFQRLRAPRNIECKTFFHVFTETNTGKAV